MAKKIQLTWAALHGSTSKPNLTFAYQETSLEQFGANRLTMCQKHTDLLTKMNLVSSSSFCIFISLSASTGSWKTVCRCMLHTDQRSNTQTQTDRPLSKLLMLPVPGQYTKRQPRGALTYTPSTLQRMGQKPLIHPTLDVFTLSVTWYLASASSRKGTESLLSVVACIHELP